jgi:multiple sugar transport system substrate-binding protein
VKNLRKPVVLALVLILALSTVLFGCSSGNKKEDSGTKSDAATSGGNASTKSGEKVKLTWLVRTDPAMLSWEKNMIKTFEESHPNISVELQRIPQTEIDQRLSTMIAGGKLADVWSSNWSNSGFLTYLRMGGIMDLTPFFQKDDQFLSTLNKEIVDQFTVDGKNYGVPMLNLGSFIYYNKELFDAAGVDYPPTDWEDTSWNYDKVLEVAQKLSHDVGTSKQVFGFMNSFSADLQAWAFGGDFFKPDAYKSGYPDGQVQVVTDINKQAIQYNADLINKYKVSPNQATMDAVSQVGDPFLTGKVAMVMTGGWGFWSYNTAKFKWGVAPMPYHEGRVAPLYADPWNISKNSKHPEEAWEFIKHLVDPKAGGKEFMESTSATPADNSLADQWYQQMADKTGMTAEQIKQLNEGAIKNGKSAIGNVLINYAVIGNTINQSAAEIWNGKKKVDDGLADIQKNLDSLKIKQ